MTRIDKHILIYINELECENINIKKRTNVQCAHPTLFVFLQKLIDEENLTQADIIHIKSYFKFS
jgi:hypothetical protein